MPQRLTGSITGHRARPPAGIGASCSRGFTVIELVLVIALVGALAVFAAPRIFNLSDFNARGFHDETLALLRYATRKQGIVVNTQLTDGLPPVWGREGALRGTLMNLCLNAVQAMPSGGNLMVRTRATAEHVVYEVEDDGPGIAAEHLGHIWDPFFTTKPVGQGTGLGLSITQRIVTDHGGDIRVASTPGRGACFTVTLPVRSDGGEIG